MKVVVSGYVGKKVTGIGRNLISLLAYTGEENEYVVYANRDFANEFRIGKGNVLVREYGVSKESSLGNLLWTTFVFPFKVATERADLALIPNFTLLLLKFRPTVVIMHDLIEFNVPDKFSRLKMFYRTRIADPVTAYRADRLITISECSKNDIVEYLNIPASKIDVINCGVDREKFYPMGIEEACAVVESRGWPGKFILFAGTIDHPGKNPYTVIKAYELLCEDGYTGSLVLAGMPGKGYDYVVEAVESSPVRERITFTGYVSDDELVALYSLCDAFCFPSLYEGFGMPPLEALACGANVVVSNTSSLPEVVGECGVKVIPNDAADVASGLTKVISDERSMGSVEDHLSRFEWSQLAERFERCLSRAASCIKTRRNSSANRGTV